MALGLVKNQLDRCLYKCRLTDDLLIFFYADLQHHCCLIFKSVLLPKLMAGTIEITLEQELFSEPRSYHSFNWQRLLFILSLTDAR